MNPISNTPSGSHGNPAIPGTSHSDAPAANAGSTAGTINSTVGDYKQKANDGIQAILDSGKQTLEDSKKWLDESNLGDKAKELPQKAKDLGSQALSKFNGLTTTQKVVGVSLLTAGIAYLATRGKKDKDDEGDYRLKSRRSPFAKKSKEEEYERGPRGQQRPWGSSRYGSYAAPAGTGKGRVMAGSGYQPNPKHEHPDHQRDQGQRPTPPAGDQRRDQGPSAGNRYDANTSGGQNPNNLDQLNSAY